MDKSKKEFNYGLACLRIWMCFEVVCVHYLNRNNVTHGITEVVYRLVYNYMGIACPIFMVLAFYFTDVERLATNPDDLSRRFYRLYVPHVFWTIIYYVVFFFMSSRMGFDFDGGAKVFFLQLVLGHCYNQSTWFQIDLIILTVLFVLIYKFIRDYAEFVISFLPIIAFIFQYSGDNVNLMNCLFIKWMGAGNVPYTIARLVEMLPYAALGVLLRKLRKNIIHQHYHIGIMHCLLVLYLICRYEVFAYTQRGYGYSGIDYFVITFLTCILFGCAQVKFPKIILVIISFLSKYTMAVYFSHRLIGTIFQYLNIGIWKMVEGTLRGCMLIYITCLIIAVLISLVPIKIIRDAVI